MAITINKQPAEFHSGYNPVEYEITSTFRSELGFRYVIELFEGSTKFAEFSVAPDVTDGNKGKIDISRILQNKLDGYFANNNYNPSDAIGTYFEYQIRFGESRTGQWKFDDYIFLSGGSLGLTTDSAYGAGFSNATHNYQVGDQIKVQLNQTYQDNRQFLNTYFEVVEVIDDKTVKLNAYFGLIGSFPATPGTATFADNRKAITRNVANVTKTAINTAMDLKEYSDTNGDLSLYDVRNESEYPNIKILTNQPLVYKVTLDQYVYFNVLNTLGGDDVMYINTDNGSHAAIGFNTETVSTVGVGPANLPSAIASNINFDNLKWYEIGIARDEGDIVTPVYKFIIDRRCKMNDTQILFMDRKGSYNSFAFQLRNRENVNTSKETYNKHINDYTTYSRGTTVYHSEVEKNLDLVTNFMGEAMNLYYEELMTSRNTYIKWKGIWYACIVTDTTFENEFERNNKMINKTVNVKFAVNNPIN